MNKKVASLLNLV